MTDDIGLDCSEDGCGFADTLATGVVSRLLAILIAVQTLPCLQVVLALIPEPLQDQNPKLSPGEARTPPQAPTLQP